MFKNLWGFLSYLFSDTAVTAFLKINGFHTASSGYGVPKEMYAELDARDIPFIVKTADSGGGLYDGVQVVRARLAAGRTNIHTLVYRRSLRIDSDPSYDPNVPNYNESPYNAAVRHWAFHKALFPAEVRDNKDIVWGETWVNAGGIITKTIMKKTRGQYASKAKLSPDDVRKIREMHKTREYTYQEISDLYGVHKNTIASAVRGKAWSHIS